MAEAEEYYARAIEYGAFLLQHYYNLGVSCGRVWARYAEAENRCCVPARLDESTKSPMRSITSDGFMTSRAARNRGAGCSRWALQVRPSYRSAH